jgi:hypothetical protein
MRITRILRWASLCITFFLIVLLTVNTLSYLNFSADYGFLKLKQHAITSGWYLPAYYAHVLAGGLILLVGFFQLFTKYSEVLCLRNFTFLCARWACYEFFY